jgi:hypothetical protein
MNERLEAIRKAAAQDWERIKDRVELEMARVRHMGRKSELNELLVPQYEKYAWSVCKDFDYAEIPWPGERYWVKTCSSLF